MAEAEELSASERGNIPQGCPMTLSDGRRARDAPSVLQEILQRDLAVARSAVELYNSNTPPPIHRQIPHVDLAALAKLSCDGVLTLKARGVSSDGEDETWEQKVSLSKRPGDKDDQPLNAATRLALYILFSRGRFTKVQKKQEKLYMNNSLYLAERHQLRREKEAYLKSNKALYEATVVERFSCNADPEWSARVLQVLAPRLEEISLDHCGPEHLRILQSMPRLRRLKLWIGSDDFACDDIGPFDWDDERLGCEEANDLSDPTRPWWPPKVPPGHRGLVYLKADFPRHVLLPLIARHSQTLRELVLEVSLPPEPGEECIVWQRRWVWICCDLPERLSELVQRFPMPALRLLELARISSHSDEGHRQCDIQLRAVRKVMGPNVTVRCSKCG